jgi:hypothetical protein
MISKFAIADFVSKSKVSWLCEFVQTHLDFSDEINYSKCVLAIITELLVRVISVL